ncbi:Unknown protein, partial [Striga hermonthica]
LSLIFISFHMHPFDFHIKDVFFKFMEQQEAEFIDHKFSPSVLTSEFSLHLGIHDPLRLLRIYKHLQTSIPALQLITESESLFILQYRRTSLRTPADTGGLSVITQLGNPKLLASNRVLDGLLPAMTQPTVIPVRIPNRPSYRRP